MTSGPTEIVIGAGVAGLACAQALAAAGRRPLVLEKSRGVGGRCATRRIEGQPVDHGVAFLHGSDPHFLDALASVDHATPIPGWPFQVHGAGAPCQPDAFRPGEQRLAFAEGLTAFPKRLSRGLEIHFEVRAKSLALRDGRFVVTTELGADFEAPAVVLALPVEQARALVDPLETGSAELEAARRLLAMVASQPALTVIAGYPRDAAALAWDVAYPEDSSVLQVLSHDSSKRSGATFLTLVLQARARWSSRRLETEPADWSAEILSEAARLLGSWAATPAWRHQHRWRYARTDRGSEFSAPMLLSLPGGARLGLAGEVFAPGGGLEAAWASGRRLAARLLDEAAQ